MLKSSCQSKLFRPSLTLHRFWYRQLESRAHARGHSPESDVERRAAASAFPCTPSPLQYRQRPADRRQPPTTIFSAVGYWGQLISAMTARVVPAGAVASAVARWLMSPLTAWDRTPQLDAHKHDKTFASPPPAARKPDKRSRSSAAWQMPPTVRHILDRTSRLEHWERGRNRRRC